VQTPIRATTQKSGKYRIRNGQRADGILPRHSNLHPFF
jgi:hypothetical protein